MNNLFLTFTMLLLTVFLYFVMNVLYVRLRSPFLVPILTTTIAVIIVLSLLDVSYETYMIGGKWIDALLGPAIVSLCIPLYKQRDVIRKNLLHQLSLPRLNCHAYYTLSSTVQCLFISSS